MANIQSEWDEFTRRIYISAPIQVVYDAWATPAALMSWFLEDAKLHTSDDTERPLDARANPEDLMTWKWFGYDIIEQNTVLAVNGKDAFQFTFGINSTVTIRLEERNGRTLLELTQKHEHPEVDNRKAMYMDCHAPWSYHITNLKSILEGGIDLREKGGKDVKFLVNA